MLIWLPETAAKIAILILKTFSTKYVAFVEHVKLNAIETYFSPSSSRDIIIELASGLRLLKESCIFLATLPSDPNSMRAIITFYSYAQISNSSFNGSKCR